MFRFLVRVADPQDPSLFWSLRRNARPRAMASSIALADGGSIGLGRRLGSAGTCWGSAAPNQAGITSRSRMLTHRGCFMGIFPFPGSQSEGVCPESLAYSGADAPRSYFRCSISHRRRCSADRLLERVRLLQEDFVAFLQSSGDLGLAAARLADGHGPLFGFAIL